MEIDIYQIDAFTDTRFAGNPAAVCPLDAWLPDGAMQSIAMENNLSETAFIVKEPETRRIRWFTPVTKRRHQPRLKRSGRMSLDNRYVAPHYLTQVAEQMSEFKQLSYSHKEIALGDRVFDLGCGPGVYTLPLAALVSEAGRVIAGGREVRAAAIP